MSITELLQLIRSHSKYDLSGIKDTYLIRQIHHHQQKAGITNQDDFHTFLLRDATALNNLVKACLNNATRFFRNPQLFDILRQHIFPDLISQKTSQQKPLKIWVTACSTGDEAYSLAIVLDQLLAETPTTPKTQILATDLSVEAIKTAQAGSTLGSNLVDVSDDVRKRYFTYQDGRYYVKPVIKDYVKFMAHDFLLPQTHPNAIPFTDFDLIICRNALLYYDNDSQIQAIRALHNYLNNNGLFILSEFELMPRVCTDLFQKSEYAPYIFSKK